jgi:hypothetical protein
VRRSEHPQNVARNQLGAHTWKARMSRARGGSVDLWGRPTPGVGPPVLCFLRVAVRWVLKAVPGAHMDLRQFGRIAGP